MRLAQLAPRFLAACVSAAPAAAQPSGGPVRVDQAIVYIECRSADGRTSRGTGVLVSGEGAVLTAKHVVPVGFTCMGGVGTAATTPSRRLLRGTQQVFVDAMLLRFVRAQPGEEFPFVRYRNIHDALRGKSVVAHGFPNGGAWDVFQTEGTIAQTNIDERGIVGTTALQSSGMSGGPVLLKDDGSLIGIIVGADFDPGTGSPSSFGVLAAQEVATVLGLTPVPPSSTGGVPTPPPDGQTVALTGAVTVPSAPPSYVPQHEGLLREALIATARGICPDTMSPLLRATCQQQMPTFAHLLSRKGNIVSTKFTGIQPTPMGNAEVYSVSFNQESMVWMINTTADGRILVFSTPSQ